MDLLGILIFTLVVIARSYAPDQAMRRQWSKVHHHQIKPRAYGDHNFTARSSGPVVVQLSSVLDQIMEPRWSDTRHRCIGPRTAGPVARKHPLLPDQMVSRR